MNSILKILFVEDSICDAELIWHEILRNKIAFDKVLVDNKQDFLEALKSYKPDIIISDYTLPNLNGMAALLLRNEFVPFVPFLLVTGSISEEVAVECIKAGADDYILKENLSRLVPAIISSLNKSKLTKEKKVAEDELYRSEQRLQKAQSIAHVGNWEIDLSSRMVLCSEEALSIYGLDKGQKLLPLDLVRSIPLEEYRPILDEIFDDLLKHNEVYEIEFKARRVNDGEIRTVFSKAELMVEPGSDQVKVTGVIQDITERKKAEEALALNNLLLRTQQESSSEAILIVDENDNILNFNQKFIEFSKMPKELVELGADIPVRQYVAEQTIDPEEFLNKVKHLNEFREEISNDEINFKDGRTYERYSAPMFGPDKKYYGRVWYFHDITDRKLAAETISQERRMLRTLIDNIPDTIYVKDYEGRKVIANAADVRSAGRYSEAEVLGKSDIDLYPGESGRRGYTEDMKILQRGSPMINQEDETVQPDGSKRWLLTTKIPIHDKSGKITGLVGIGHDITERKENEKELIRAKIKAEESDKLKTAFLHNISHEIRTPMNAIVGFSALLGEPDIDKESRESYIEVIMQSSDHLLQIISDIVDISNIEANIVKTLQKDVNINQVLKSLISQFTPAANKKQIELSYEAALPDNDAVIVTDSTKLNQVLSNLLSNALKFTEKGSVKIWYQVHDHTLDINIADTGIGIASEHFNKIFERFYQIQNPVSRLYEGTGLGLSISKAYAEHLGGKIWLTSEQGKGTTFSVSIPYEKASKVPVEVSMPKAREGFVFPVKKVILVAEDVESNFKLIKYFLSGSNAELIHACNGKEAVDKYFANNKIDLILMDIKMPVMDGYTAVKLIREKNSLIPIVAQTAYADDREKAFECGCSGFISKPFDKKSLFNVLKEFI